MRPRDSLPEPPRKYFFSNTQDYLPLLNNYAFQTPNHALFFMMKSFNEANILYGMHHGIWCSTNKGNCRLNQLFMENPYTPIYLFFSANESGAVQGMAQMKSNVDFNTRFPLQNHQNKWKGIFSLHWLYVKTIPNDRFRHIRNTLNEDKPFTNSRDCQ